MSDGATAPGGMGSVPRINVIVRLPFDRPADWVEPPQVSDGHESVQADVQTYWDDEKQALLEEVLSQSHSGKGVECEYQVSLGQS